MNHDRLTLHLDTTSVEADGCFGVLKAGSKYICLTLERTFPPDERPIIPAGTYVCKKTRFHRGGYDTFEVTGVEGHSRLLFHKGNTEEDSVGCILVGSDRGELDGVPAILGSGRAFDRFWSVVKDEAEFDLEVIGR